MPKNSFKLRTERTRGLSRDELALFLWDPKVRCSAKLARWIYEVLADDEFLKIKSIERIGWDERAPWSNAFLWRELAKLKQERFGDWLVICLCRPGTQRAEDAEAFMDLYEDPTAHQETRGSAVFGVNNAMTLSSFETPPVLPDATMDRARRICRLAANDADNPYARAGAVWLGQLLGGFEEELERLRLDQTPAFGEGGLTVADHF
jgi:hypothetical protein